MNQPNNAPSLFDNGEIGTGIAPNANRKISINSSLIDLLYDGFYIVFLLRNGYVPHQPEVFQTKIMDLLNRFEMQAKKMHFSADDIADAKYVFCSLLDETIVTQQDPVFFNLQNLWLINPLQLKLFGSQLAGDQFFDKLEQLRARGKDRLASLEVAHYCLLLGFQGRYRLESVESLNHLVSRVGDEIDFLKGKKTAFSPFSSLPDQIRNIIHRELPFMWILIFIIAFALITFTSLRFMLSKNEQAALAPFKNVISTPVEQAHITIHLP